MDFATNIKNNEQIRESLIGLKLQVQKEASIQNDTELKDKLIHLLNDEDPKVRKNSAVLLGHYPGTVDILLEAYKHEKTDYVKDAYLKGMSMQDCRLYFRDLQMIQSHLMNLEDTTPKHVQAQLKILKHTPVDVILTSLPYYQFVLFADVLHLRYKPVSQGVLVRTDSIYDLLPIRTYKDMLIPLQGASGLDMSLETIMNGFERCNIEDIFDRLYDDHSVFYFRVVDAMREKKPQLIKKISEKLFELYPQKLLNATENYDIEIVIKEVQRGKVNAYLRLIHLNNPRFQYRREVSATSMQSYVAATMVQLAKPYMIEDAKVLDPFVGTGTLLIERCFAKSAHFVMGIDVYGQGIESARKNAKLAGQNIYFVHKDSLRFVNNEMFDEIITDMPTFAQMKDQEQLQNLYDRFFERIRRLVKPGGYVFLYTSEISLVRKNLRLQEGYLSLEEHYEVPRGKNMFYFFIIKVK